MATIYKRRDLRPIPEGAEIVTYRGKRYAKWTNAKGNAQRAPLNDAGDKIVCESPYYTVRYFDHTGRRVKVATRCADKDAAQQLANELETQAMKRREGLIDPTQERLAAEARRPLQAHVADYLAALLAKGNTAKHAELTGARVRFILHSCGATHSHDLQPSVVQSTIKAIHDAGRSLETCNSYLRAVKGFSRWLWRDKRTPDDSLATLQAYNAATDRRHVRRELTCEELACLLQFVETHTTEAHNMPGQDRAMLYRLALGTGFRANELRSLMPSSFDLQAELPTVTVAAGHSKRRRQDIQLIRSDLAEQLRAWLDGRPRDERVFPRMPRNMARSFRKDLAAARDAWIAEATTDVERQRRAESDFLRYADANGRVADFHATRHTYISGIVATGASVKTAQELARHSTPVLTIGRYSHARLHDLTGALEALPNLQPAKSEPTTQAATGTDGGKGLTCGPERGQKRGQWAGKTVQNVASSGERHDGCCEPKAAESANSQPVILSTLGNKKATSGGTWLAAEGTGLEPATPYGAPHLQ